MTRSGSRGIVFGIVCAVVALGCDRDEEPSREVDPDLVSIDTEHMRLRTDDVGVGDDRPRATFVLVDAHNTSDRPLMVTLDGALLDAAGDEVGQLRADSLRVPPDGIRTFALVEKELRAPAGATTARVRVAGAYESEHEPALLVDDSGGAYLDNDRVVVNGNVVNRAERRAKVIVIAGFYDQDGVLMTRPFEVLTIGPGAKRPVQFVGPQGSVKGYMFIGDAVF